jgi:hypothetical protein
VTRKISDLAGNRIPTVRAVISHYDD